MEGESTVGALTSEANQMSWDLYKKVFVYAFLAGARTTVKRIVDLLSYLTSGDSFFRLSPSLLFPTCNLEMQLRRRRNLRQILSEWEKGAKKTDKPRGKMYTLPLCL